MKSFVHFSPPPEVKNDKSFFASIWPLNFFESKKESKVESSTEPIETVHWKQLSQLEKSRVAILKVRRKDKEQSFSKGESELKCFTCKQNFGLLTRRATCQLCFHSFCRSSKCLESVEGRYVGVPGTAKVCTFCAVILSIPLFQGNNTINTLLDSLLANEEESYTPSPATGTEIEKEELLSLSKPPGSSNTSSPTPATSPAVVPTSRISSETKKPESSSPSDEVPNLKKTAVKLGLGEAAMWIRSPRKQGLNISKRTNSRILVFDNPSNPLARTTTLIKKTRMLDDLSRFESRPPEDLDFDLSLNLDAEEEKMLKNEPRNAHDLYLEEFVEMALTAEGVEVSRWKYVVLEMAKMVANNLKPKTSNQKDKADIRKYLKIKTIPGGKVSDSRYISGLVFDKNRTHKKMKGSFKKPRILLISDAIEYSSRKLKPPTQNNTDSLTPSSSNANFPDVSSADNSMLSDSKESLSQDSGRPSQPPPLPKFPDAVSFISFEELKRLEEEFLRKIVSNIERLHPDIIFVEKHVARLAQELLLEQNITLVVNLKPHIMNILSRICQTQLLNHPPGLHATVIDSSTLVTSCEELYFQTFEIPSPTKSSEQPPKKNIRRRPNPTDMPSPPTSKYSAKAYDNTEKYKKTCVFLEGCPSDLFATLVLRGSSSLLELSKVKKVLKFSAYVAHSLRLEKIFSDLHMATLKFPPRLVPLRPPPMKPLSCSLCIQYPPDISHQSAERTPGSLVLPDMLTRPTLPNLVATSEISHTDIDTTKGNVINPLDIKFDCRAVRNYNKPIKKSLLEPKAVTLASVENEQSIIYVHALCCTATPSLCIIHELHIIDFYSPNDMSLGDFLTKFCFDDSFLCKSIGCNRDMLDHERCFIHHKGRLNVSVKGCAEPLDIAGAGQEGFFMAEACPDQKKQFIPVSEEALKFSFGRYLEMTFYSKLKCTRCKTEIYQHHTRYFYYRRKVAVFQYEPVSVMGVVLPPLHVPLDRKPLRMMREMEINNLHKTVITVFDEILCRLHALSEYVNSIDPRLLKPNQQKTATDLMEEITNQINCQGIEYKDWRAKIEDAYNDSQSTDSFSVNTLQRDMYNTTGIWNTTISDMTKWTLELLTEINRANDESHRNLESLPPKIDPDSSGPPPQTSKSRNTGSRTPSPTTTPRIPTTSMGATLTPPISPRYLKPIETELESAPPELQNKEQEEESRPTYDNIIITNPSPIKPINTLNSSETKVTIELPNTPQSISLEADAILLETIGSPVLPLPNNPNNIPLSPDLSTNELNTSVESTESFQPSPSNPQQVSPSPNNRLSLNKSTHTITPTKSAQFQNMTNSPNSMHAIPTFSDYSARVLPHKQTQSSKSLATSTWKEPQSMPVIAFPNRTTRMATSDRNRSEKKLISKQRSRSPSPTTKRFAESIAKLNKFTQTPLISLVADNDVHLLFPPGVQKNVIPVRAVELSSFVVHALSSTSYHEQYQNMVSSQSFNEEPESSHPDTTEETSNPTKSQKFSSPLHSNSTIKLKEEPVQTKKNVSSSIVVKYKQEGSENKSIDYSCEVYFPVEFTKLRKLCDISPDDYCQSLARSKGFDAKGGKSGASFSKTFDDRFILKKISKNELDSFIEFADQYFFYFFKEVSQRLVPTALAKIFGIYSLTYRGNTTTFNNYFIVVMENLFYKRNITKIFDLKGSMRNRHSMDQTSILLDEDLLERMYEYPMCLQQKGKADLGMAVWNDSVFLARLNVMDYSLLVGIDEENGEYVVGIIDYLRKYGWDKQFESWVKKTGMLAGGKVPTIISPKQYEKRFQYAIWLYFLMVPSKGLQFVNDLTEESTKKMS